MIDLERITNPLRLAAGSHEEGSGRGCAMNVISYINGDTKITDFPECSAKPLARMVQVVNDHLARPDGFLSPQDSVSVLDLGWKTVGTRGLDDRFVGQWLNEICATATLILRNGWVDNYWLMHAASRIVQFGPFPNSAFHSRMATGAAGSLSLAVDRNDRFLFVDQCINRWRELMGLDSGENIQPAAVDAALEKMGV